MNRAYGYRCLGLAAVFALGIGWTWSADLGKPAAADSTKGSPARAEPGQLEARFTDGGMLRVTVQNKNVELVTPYGKLIIPIGDIERIEMGRRVAPDVQRRIDAAVAALGSAVFKDREAATADLLALKEKAYPAVLKAAKHTDPEIARRAEEILAKLRETVPDDVLEVPDYDVVYTATSKIAGQIIGDVLKVDTMQFGELQMRLADVRTLRSPAAAEPVADGKDVLADPGSMTSYAQQTGKTLRFRVTGAVQGSLWGTDIYTTDSTLAMAATHAGIVKPGQTGIVKVTILPAQQAFAGSTRNGVASSAYGQYPSAFQIHRKRTD